MRNAEQNKQVIQKLMQSLALVMAAIFIAASLYYIAREADKKAEYMQSCHDLGGEVLYRNQRERVCILKPTYLEP